MALRALLTAQHQHVAPHLERKLSLAIQNAEQHCDKTSMGSDSESRSLALPEGQISLPGDRRDLHETPITHAPSSNPTPGLHSTAVQTESGCESSPNSMANSNCGGLSETMRAVGPTMLPAETSGKGALLVKEDAPLETGASVHVNAVGSVPSAMSHDLHNVAKQLAEISAHTAMLTKQLAVLAEHHLAAQSALAAERIAAQAHPLYQDAKALLPGSKQTDATIVPASTDSADRAQPVPSLCGSDVANLETAPVPTQGPATDRPSTPTVHQLVYDAVQTLKAAGNVLMEQACAAAGHILPVVESGTEISLHGVAAASERVHDAAECAASNGHGRIEQLDTSIKRKAAQLRDNHCKEHLNVSAEQLVHDLQAAAAQVIAYLHVTTAVAVRTKPKMQQMEREQEQRHEQAPCQKQDQVVHQDQPSELSNATPPSSIAVCTPGNADCGDKQ
jgi:hypothetical protein